LISTSSCRTPAEEVKNVMGQVDMLIITEIAAPANLLVWIPTQFHGLAACAGSSEEVK
jgi:hypothetical protein